VEPAQITRTQVEEFIVSGTGENGGEVKPRTINQRLAAIRALYKYLRRERPELGDPSAGIRFARVPRMEALHVTGEDGTSLLSYLWERAERKDLREPIPYRLRDPLLFELLWLTGGRVSEVAGLDVGSITLGPTSIRILYHGKGGKERVIPIPLKEKGQVIKKAWALQNRIRFYLLSARPRFLKAGEPTEALFLSKNGRRLTTRSIERLLEKYVHELGLPAYTPHSLRHGAATRLLEYDVDLKTISEILGHASAAVTATIYVHTGEKRKAQAMAKVL
jgi:integrase/recombinase XerC